MDRNANPLALPLKLNPFKDAINRVSPCVVLGNAACRADFRGGGPGYGLEVGNKYLTFTTT